MERLIDKSKRLEHAAAKSVMCLLTKQLDPVISLEYENITNLTMHLKFDTCHKPLYKSRGHTAGNKNCELARPVFCCRWAAINWLPLQNFRARQPAVCILPLGTLPLDYGFRRVSFEINSTLGSLEYLIHGLNWWRNPRQRKGGYLISQVVNIRVHKKPNLPSDH